MSEQITEERIKMILSKREKMLRDINEKVILLIKDLDRSDDDLITEKSIYDAVNRNMSQVKAMKMKTPSLSQNKNMNKPKL